MDIGEAVNVSLIKPELHNEKTCPFCSADESDTKENLLDNDAEKLRASCHEGDLTGLPEPCTSRVGSPQWKVEYTHPVTGDEAVSEVRSNPHHCIPGEASLKGRSEHPILKAIEKAKGTITGDIGYNVNGRLNGVWLPTIIEHFYGGYQSTDPIAGITWGSLSKKYPEKQFSMAEAAMHETRRQFHDAHPEYSLNVKQRLDKLLNKLVIRKLNCPIAGPKGKPDVPPPYALVQWLNALSHAMAGHLVGEAPRWRDPMFTSRHAKAFRNKLK